MESLRIMSLSTSQPLSPPSPEELKFLRCFDPRRLFLGGERAKGPDEGRKRG